MTTPVPLYEHTPKASDVCGLHHCEQVVKLTKDQDHPAQVHVGWAVYSLDQARDLVATVLAAIEVGERAG